MNDQHAWIQPPLQRAWWESEQFKRTFSLEFVEEIQNAEGLEVHGSLINRRP